MTDPDPFHPARGLSGPTRQTILGKVLRAHAERAAPPLRVDRRRWDTPDGDFLDLDLSGPDDPGSPTVVVLHGLEGSTRRPYVRLFLRMLAVRGLRGVALNFRSCSGEPNRLARSYHSGDTADLRWVIERLRESETAGPLAAVGFSLGGNVLLKYLGEEGGSAPLVAAVAVSVPFDLSAGADAIQKGPQGILYTRYFLRSLKRKVRWKSDLLGPDLTRAALAARTIREFDEALTAPVHGFGSAEEYYRQSSSAGYLGRVRVPTLVLHALDDPFQPESALPRKSMVENRSVHPVLTARGGHLGFVGTGPDTRRFFWAERNAADWLAIRLETVRPGRRR